MNAVMKAHRRLDAWILENLASAVILFDIHLRVNYLNPSAEMLLASSARNIIGQTADQLFQCATGKNNEARTHLTQIIEARQHLTEREIEVILPDGRQVTVDCSVIPLSELDGSEGVLLELQQVDRHLRITREKQLVSRQALTRDVVRGLAHEIKNPLGGLRGAAQLLEAELENDELKEYTQVIIDEADRLQGLVNSILGPNRLPEYKELNIHHVLERVRSLVMAETGQRIKLIRDYDPSIPDLLGDLDQLIQATLNIVKNAQRAIGDTGNIILKTRVLRQFTLGNRMHKLVARVDIIDDGPGIPESIKDKLFYPMVTGGTGGLGLGLSIAQSIINQHKGVIECSSEPGNTAFTIYLPLLPTHYR